jgi:hypothetical protein
MKEGKNGKMSFRLCKLSGILLLWTLLSAMSAAADDNTGPPPLSTDAIVHNLMAANERRAAALRSYRGKRFYRIDYHGIFGDHDAEIVVEATYNAPDTKNFQVISQSGSRLFGRVLLRLLESEKEAQESQNRKALEVTPHNYRFSLEKTEHTPAGDFYVLNVEPIGKSRYLYRGKIWVDAHDFAVARMQGVPQKNPSMWVSHTEIEYRWAKIDGFWLPVYNDSQSQVRMGGKALLTIHYTDYQITGVNPGATGTGSNNEILPNPAAVTADPH